MTDASPPALTREEWAALLALADTSPGRAWPEQPAASRALFSAAFALEARGLVERIEDNDVQYVPTPAGILALKRLGIPTARIEAMAGRLRVERADARALTAARKVVEGWQPAAPGYAEQTKAWITAWDALAKVVPHGAPGFEGADDQADAHTLHVRRAARRARHRAQMLRVWAALDELDCCRAALDELDCCRAALDELDCCRAAEAAADRAEWSAGRPDGAAGRSWTLAEALGASLNSRGRDFSAMAALGEILGLDPFAASTSALRGDPANDAPEYTETNPEYIEAEAPTPQEQTNG